MPILEEDDRYARLTPKQSLENIPYFPQIEDQCGPASLATMLVIQGVDVTPEELRGKIYIPGKEGTVTTEIIARARQYGLLAYVLQPKLIDILTEIDAGNPVLVMQNLGFNWLPRWHFSVAVAYDLERQMLSLRSGNEVRHEVDFELFVKTWQRAKSWAIVIVHPDKIPATATQVSMVQTASELEQVGQIKSALSAYQTILKRWPENLVAKFGAGNASYALNDYKSAEQLFSSYLESEPKAHVVWNNLAYTLAARGCVEQAKQAIQCAVSIAPENQLLLESHQEIQQMSGEAIVQCQAQPCPKERN